MAAAACLLRICDVAPHVGLGFIGTLVDLLAHGRAVGGATASIAMECLAIMAEAGELTPLPLLDLLRRTFGVAAGKGWEQAICGSGELDATGAALVRCMACVAVEYR